MRTCEGSATPTLATGSGSFDFARKLASLRMTLACEGSATRRLERLGRGSFDCARRLASLRMTLHSVRGADQVQDSRVSRSGRIATDQKAVRTRGPGRVVLGSKPQLATTEKLVSWVQRVSWVTCAVRCVTRARAPG